MDVVWDQDVRTALSAIISREPCREPDQMGSKVKSHIQLAIQYAEELGKARAIAERKPHTPTTQYRRTGR